MQPYLLVLFVHVAAAMALVGGSVIASTRVRATVRSARTTQELRAFLAIGRPLAVLNPVASMLVFASGLYLASVGRFWALGWVQVAVAFWVVNVIVAVAVVKPAIARTAMEAARAGDGAVGERLDAIRWSLRWSVGSDVLVANDSAMLYLMAVKPGFAGSLLAVAVANALALAGRIAFGRPRAERARPAEPRVAAPAGRG